MNIESDFMSLGKNDLLKSVGIAIIGAIITAAEPAISPILTALNSGVLPVVPSADVIQAVLLKGLGSGLGVAGVYLTHKFLSNSDGVPLNGALTKIINSKPKA